MTKCRFSPFLTVLIIFSILFILLPTSSYSSTHEAIVKVFTTSMSYNYGAPWQTNSIEEWSGSGCIISGKRILTNAHVISNATFIEVQKHGDPARFTASVVAVSHDADLALLQVEDDKFFNDTTPLKLGGLPDMLDEVLVYGFPEGGEGLSVTKGIISRIETIEYIHSRFSLLGLQIDAAINSGNSGGPAVKNGKIVGVAMQSKKKAENIGYIIPTPIIKHFLTDLKDGRYDGFPDDGVVFKPLLNTALKTLLNFPNAETGVYISLVVPGTAADGLLLPGDVILCVDNHQVANDGTILVRPGLRVQVNYCTLSHQIGESSIVTVWRNGSKQKIDVPLTTNQVDTQLIKPPQYDCRPEYYILGGIVFTPLSINYFLLWEDAPWQLMRYIYKYREKANEQVVIINGLLSSEMTAGNDSVVNERVISVNGQSFSGFKSFAAIVDVALTKNKFITLKTENHDFVVVSSQEHRKNEKKLLELYGIDAPYQIDGMEPL